MEYRLGNMEDLDAICCLFQEAIDRMVSQGIDQWDTVYPSRADFVTDIERGTLYVAMEGEQILAVYVLSTECDPEYEEAKWKYDGEKACIIHRLCVSPKVQNRGIGRKLLDHIEEQLIDMGYCSVRLDVFSQNPFAIRLYEKNGYIKRGDADWRKGRFWLMEKELNHAKVKDQL